MTDGKRHVLLIAYINSHLPELLRAGQFLQSTGRHNVLLLFMDNHDTLKSSFAEQCVTLQIPIFDLAGNERTSAPVSNPSQHTERSIVQQLRKYTFLRRLLDWLHTTTTTLLYLPSLIRQQRAVRSFLKKQTIHLVLLAEENPGYQTTIVIREAKASGIGSVVIPYTIANATEAAEHAFDTPRLWIRGPLSRFVAWRYPKWEFRHRGKRLLLMPAFRVLATELLHLAPPDPWMINGGFSDAIAVESPFMQYYYRQNGLEKHRLALTGSVSDDLLFQTQQKTAVEKQEAIAHLGLNPLLPVILTAFPPPWFPRPECDFPDYPSLAAFWLDTLKELRQWNVIVSAHPGISSDDRAILGDFGLPITDQNVIDLLPLCDLYVASISATIRWAIALGKPVVNYDVYKYRFHDYDTAQGVITLEGKDEFRYTLSKLTEDSQFRSSLAGKQRTCSATWGMLDGRCGERLLALFDQLARRP